MKRNMAYSKNQPKNTDMEKLGKELQEGIFQKVYLFYGEERYLVLRYKDRLMKATVAPDDSMNLNIHKEASPDVSKVTDECLSMPFFADRRMVVVQDSGYFSSGKGSDEKEKDRLISLIGQLPDTTVLLFVETNVDKRSRVYKAVGKAGMTVSFEHPDGHQLSVWVKSKLRDHSIKITDQASDILFDRTGTDMSMISSQLDKLISCVGEGGTVTPEVVKGLVSERLEASIFNLVDAVGRRKRKEAVVKYDELVRMKEEKGRILYFIARQFNQLYQTKVLLERGAGRPEMMKAVDLKFDFQLRKLIDQSGYFTKDQLRMAVQDCVEMETRYKSGRIDVSMAIEMLLVKYSR